MGIHNTGTKRVLQDYVADPWALLNADINEFVAVTSAAGFEEQWSHVWDFLVNLRALYHAKAAGSYVGVEQALGAVNQFLAASGPRLVYHVVVEGQGLGFAMASVPPTCECDRALRDLSGHLAHSLECLVVRMVSGKVFVCAHCGRMGPDPGKRPKLYCGSACRKAGSRARQRMGLTCVTKCSNNNVTSETRPDRGVERTSI
jgi:hypothetical protein